MKTLTQLAQEGRIKFKMLGRYNPENDFDAFGGEVEVEPDDVRLKLEGNFQKFAFYPDCPITRIRVSSPRTFEYSNNWYPDGNLQNPFIVVQLGGANYKIYFYPRRKGVKRDNIPVVDLTISEGKLEL